MKTETLIDLLATGEPPLARHAPRKRCALATAVGITATLSALIAFLGFNPALVHDAGVPSFWLKLAFPLAVAGLAFPMVERLARPGTRLGVLPSALGFSFLALWLIAVATLVGAPAEQRLELILGETWKTCPWTIGALSLAPFIATLWAVRGLAPTRLGLTGAACGLFAGALAAFIYAFHCPELAPSFIAVWYVLGILLPTACGALIGPRVLAW